MNADKRFLFPRWTNLLLPTLGVVAIGGPLYAIAVVWLGLSPLALSVGYAPEQPIPYSHALHVGELGLDCRYCHNTVEHAARAAIPPTQTCMNCHARVRTESDALAALRDSAATGEPVRWVRVHDLPDYVFFDHSAHVARGVGCVACHGRVDRMDVITQVEPLSMGWCLECHRDPDRHLRPLDAVTDLEWTPDGDPVEVGRRLRDARDIRPSTDCSTCHR